MNFITKRISIILYRFTFKDFFSLQLTPVEAEISKEAVELKYGPTIISSLIWSMLAIPAALFLDTSTIVLVLVPIAMVAGSAWFSITLSVVKAKFANFGNTLTQNILESFFTSLFLMLLIAIISIFAILLEPLSNLSNLFLQTISAVLISSVIIRIVYLIMIGSIKYDMNDAMLTGQNEAAQEFFSKSMNFSYQVTDLIRKEPDVKTTNYYISDGFSRIFNTVMIVQEKKGKNKTKAEKLNNNILKVLSNPEMNQKEIYTIFLSSILGFKDLLNPDNKAARMMNYVDIEIDCLKNNIYESDRIKALRYATIFTLLFEIVTSEGEDIFL